jgi:hypothetical protein
MGETKIISQLETRCPPREQYTAAQNRQMGSELEKLGGAAVTPFYLRDYRRLRQQCDAYEGKK